jgi:hypothetical protein
MSQDPLSVSAKVAIAKEKKDIADQSFKAGEFKAGMQTVWFCAIDQTFFSTCRNRNIAALQSYHQVIACDYAFVCDRYLMFWLGVDVSRGTGQVCFFRSCDRFARAVGVIETSVGMRSRV